MVIITVCFWRPGRSYSLADLGTARIRAADLGALLGLRPSDQVAKGDGAWLKMVHDGAQWLIRVDRLLGQQEVSIDFNDHHSSLPGIVGSTILMSGERAMALDLYQTLDARRTSRRRRVRPSTYLGNVPFALVADMSVSVRRVVGQMLDLLGWRAIEARDGLEAWELIESVGPELLIIDLNLPLLDGARVIRAAKARGNISVVVLTSGDTASASTTAISLGADAFLHKPLDEEELLTSLKFIGEMASRS